MKKCKCRLRYMKFHFGATLEEWIFVASAFKMQCYIHKNTLHRTAFFSNFANFIMSSIYPKLTRNMSCRPKWNSTPGLLAKLQKKSNTTECNFVYITLHIECWCNKKSLLRSYSLTFFGGKLSFLYKIPRLSLTLPLPLTLLCLAWWLFYIRYLAIQRQIS